MSYSSRTEERNDLGKTRTSANHDRRNARSVSPRFRSVFTIKSCESGWQKRSLSRTPVDLKADRDMKKILIWGFATGVLVAMCLLGIYYFGLRPLGLFIKYKNDFERIMLWLWPCSLWLMAVRGLDWVSLFIVAVAFIGNGFFYAFLACIVYFVKRLIWRPWGRIQVG
jgi:hypothetical protein